MDAAHKFVRTAILSATVLLLATAGLAQTTPTLQTQTSVGLFGSGGQEVNVNSSIPGTPITFTIGAPAYGSQDGDWLRVQGGTTTPALLTFSLQRQPFT